MIFFFALLAIAAASKDQLVNLAANDPKLMVALFNDFVRTEGRVFETPTEARMRMKNFNQYVAQKMSRFIKPIFQILLYDIRYPPFS